MTALIAVLEKEQNDATGTAITMLDALSAATTDKFGIGSPSRVKTESAVDALRNLHANSDVVIGCRFSRILPSDRKQPMLLKNATLVFDGRTYAWGRTSGVKPPGYELLHDGEETAKTLIRKAAGDYAFVVAEPGRLVAGRDPIGARPLYFGENEEILALASQRKALWKVGITTDCSFPPGNTASITQRGFRFEPVKTLSCPQPKRTTMKDAAKELLRILKHSIAERVSALKEVAIAFSGGLDSCIIARLAKESLRNIQLIHVSLEDQKETEHAREAADNLKLPILVRLFSEHDVERDLPKVLRLVEEADPVKTAVGIPFYWVAEQASEMGFKVMLAGQGADELFGGYRRYVDDCLAHGEEAAHRGIFRDVAEISKNNLERDSKICGFHNVELRLPFATFDMAKFALELPVNLKIDPETGGMRKLVLRRMAENIGLPESICTRPKKAVQYATGVDKALKRLAKRQGFAVKSFLQTELENTLKETA
jgi:asparagine synthase (glutamine-hydrolysing)